MCARLTRVTRARADLTRFVPFSLVVATSDCFKFVLNKTLHHVRSAMLRGLRLLFELKLISVVFGILVEIVELERAHLNHKEH